VSTSRESDRHVIVGYEASDVRPDTDFALFYSLGEEEAFHLIPYRDPGDADSDGFFMLLLAPRPDASLRTLPKDLILVLDRSGSMDGEKFQQAQAALRYILKQLNPDDRFNIIAFSTGMEIYASGLRPASEVNEAVPWVDRLSAVGSTDINRALLEGAAIADDERPTYLIFLTDGLPTEGVVNSQNILDNLASAAPDNLRLFTFGVGYDVDTFLLDSLAQNHHGTSTYVLPGERLDEVLSTFYAKISTPVLTDLSLDFGKITAYDIYPNPLSDLFVGSQDIVVGRYRGSGATTVTLTGKVNNKAQEFQFFDQNFPTNTTTQSALPRLWATRKIGYLLNQIRLQGLDQETIDQIVRLSIRYGIVTPYTSYLVTEEVPLGEAEHERIAGEQFNQIQTAPVAPSFGRDAVEKAAAEGALAEADAPLAPSLEVAEKVRIVGSRTYVLSDNIWVDTAYDPDQMQTQKVAFLSDEYFLLAESRPDLASGFALGKLVIALSDGIAFEVVESTEHTEPIVLPAKFTPTPEKPNFLDPQTTIDVPATEPPDKKPTSKPAVGMVPCASSMLPLVLLPIFGYMYFERRDKLAN
jgi:Ca-activated chloride channel family protein